MVVYIPDVALNHIPLDRQIKDPEELEEVLSQCYTGQDFIDECHGDTSFRTVAISLILAQGICFSFVRIR